MPIEKSRLHPNSTLSLRRFGAASAIALLGLAPGCGTANETNATPPPVSTIPLNVCTFPSPLKWQRIPAGVNAQEIADKLGVDVLRVWGGAMLTVTCSDEQAIQQVGDGMEVDVLGQDAKLNLSTSCLAIADGKFLPPGPTARQVSIICPTETNSGIPAATM